MLLRGFNYEQTTDYHTVLGFSIYTGVLFEVFEFFNHLCSQFQHQSLPAD